MRKRCLFTAYLLLPLLTVLLYGILLIRLFIFITRLISYLIIDWSTSNILKEIKDKDIKKLRKKWFGY